MTQVLYGARAGSLTTSDLYTIDPATGIATSIGPIGFAVTGLDFDPLTGTLYGITSNNSASNPRSLITVDPVTGAGTLIGPLNAGGGTDPLSDIAFSAAGVLYGLDSISGRLNSINLATGAATGIGANHSGTGGLSFASTGILYRARTDIAIMDPATGVLTSLFTNPFGFPSAAAFDAADLLWMVDAFGGSNLAALDLTTQTIVATAALSLNRFDAIAWRAAAALTANFTGTPLSGLAPLVVAFTDHSTSGPGGAITGWSWTFGDGGTSSTPSPTHTYTTPGTYTVALTVTSPDGTDTKTRIDYIVVSPAATNVDPGTALELTPSCGTTSWETDLYPVHPPGTDYPAADFWTIERQAWYRLTNSSGRHAYARFEVKNVGAGSLDVVWLELADDAGTPVATDSISDSPFWNYLFSGYETLPSDQAGQYSVLAPGASSGSNSVGFYLPPGESIWIVVGVDTGESGSIELDWKLVTVEQHDVVDTYPPGTAFGSTPWTSGDSGLSDTVPTGGADTLDYSGFPNYPGGDSKGLIASCFDGTYWWVCDVYIYSTGVIFQDATLADEYLGVWQIDAAGVIVSFNVIETVVSGFDHGPIGHDFGAMFVPNSFFSGGGGAFMRTDGSEVWLVIAKAEPQTNPFDTSIPPHDWEATHAAVYTLSSGWTQVGAIDSQVHSVPFGAGFGQFLGLDACASPSEPGVLHVVQAEYGGTFGDQAEPPWNTYGTGHFRWVTTYATFDGAGRTAQTVLMMTDSPSSGPPIQNTGSPFIWVRNDHGSPVFGWSVPRTDGTSGTIDLWEVYSLPSLTLLGQIDSTFLTGFPGGAITSLSYGGVSYNAVDDVGFDGKHIYLVALKTNNGNQSIMARLATDDWVPRYIANTQLKSNFGTLIMGLPNGSFLAAADDEGLWAWIADTLGSPGVQHYVYCAESWTNEGMSLQGAYPGLRGLVRSWDATANIVSSGDQLAVLDGDDYFSIANFTQPGAPGHLAVWLTKSHIFRDLAVCSIGDCIVSHGIHIWQRLHHNSRPAPP